MTEQDYNAHLLGRTEHHRAHGANASAVTRARYKAMASLGAGQVEKQTTLSFRKTNTGGVSLEVEVDQVYSSGKRSSVYAGVEFTPELWAHICEFVEQQRDIT